MRKKKVNVLKMKRIIRVSVLSYVLTANKFGSCIINKYGNLKSLYILFKTRDIKAFSNSRS